MSMSPIGRRGWDARSAAFASGCVARRGLCRGCWSRRCGNTRTGPPNWRDRVSSEHVEVLRHLRAGWWGNYEPTGDERAALDAAIAALSAPQPLTEAQ